MKGKGFHRESLFGGLDLDRGRKKLCDGMRKWMSEWTTEIF
jgi:hypothetical protein